MLQQMCGQSSLDGQKLWKQSSGKALPSKWLHRTLFRHEHTLQEIEVIKVKICQGLIGLTNID